MLGGLISGEILKVLFFLGARELDKRIDDNSDGSTLQLEPDGVKLH